MTRRWRPELDPRTLRLLTIAGSSYIGRLGSVLVVLITIPMARAALPVESFGVWMMINGLLTFLGFTDLGIGNSVLNRVTSAHARGDAAELRRVTLAGYAVTVTVGLVIVGAWLVWVALAADPTAVVGQAPDSQRNDVLVALHVFVLLLATNISATLVQRLQLGSQAGHWVGLTQAASAACSLLAITLVAALGAPLPFYVMGSIGMSVAVNLVGTVLWHRRRSSTAATAATAAALTPEGHASSKSPGESLPLRVGVEWPAVVSLLRTGSLFLVLQLAVALGFQSDAIVIVHQLGQAAYGDFAVVQRVFTAASSVMLAGMLGLWPALGQALASHDRDWLRRTLFRSYATVLLASGAMALALALMMPALLPRWLGVDLVPPLALLVVLALWTTLEAVGNVSGAFLNAASLLRPQVIAAVAMSVLAFSGKWVLVGMVGAWGAVLATLLAYALTSVPMQIFQIRRRLHAGEAGHAVVAR